MVSLKQINAALAAKGAAERLFKGNGYFYFSEGSADSWYSASVFVNRLSQLTLKQWLAEYESLKEENSK